MNKQLFLKIADAIEKRPKLFNQADFGNGLKCEKREVCGTPCCVFGWAIFLAGKKMPKPGEGLGWMDGIIQTGARVLGLDSRSAHLLARSSWPREWFERASASRGIPKERYYVRPTARQAATTLRSMVRDGEIWRPTWLR